MRAHWKAVKTFGFRNLPLEILEADPMNTANRRAGDGFDDVFPDGAGAAEAPQLDPRAAESAEAAEGAAAAAEEAGA